MKNNKGVTIVNMLIVIIVIIIISGVTITGGLQILNNSKNSKKEENLSAVKTAVNNISMQLNLAGTLTPANTKLYGVPASSVYKDEANLEGWYLIEQADIEEMGIEYIDENYLVNYNENKVILLSDYLTNGID